VHRDRAIISGDWRAVAMHRYGKPFDQDQWQLFNIHNDPSESTDLSQKDPAKLKQMQDLWQQQAEQYGALPLVQMPIEQQFADAFRD
jgi:arylsulfatase A-like enzyme